MNMIVVLLSNNSYMFNANVSNKSNSNPLLCVNRPNILNPERHGIEWKGCLYINGKEQGPGHGTGVTLRPLHSYRGVTSFVLV